VHILSIPTLYKNIHKNGGKFIMNKKCNITISVPNDTTVEEIKNIRQKFNKSELSKEYRLNIIISGYEEPISNLGTFLASYTKK
jgi:hypothetical protein